MVTLSTRRAYTRHLGALALGLALAGATGATDAPLSLRESAELAVAAQPLLDAQRHAVRGARAAATAAAQLPDPTIMGGVEDLMLSGPERYALEGEAQVRLGVRQSFPGGREREWRGTRGRAEADRLAAELDEQRRMVRREASLAWIDVWSAVRAQQIVDAAVAEAEQQRQAVDIAYRAGRAAQADLLAARVSLELLEDQRAGLAQSEWHARNGLRRWIGDAAERPVAPDLAAGPMPDEPALLAALERHPHLTAQGAAVAAARAGVELARTEYAPDWSVELGYGWRPDLEDMAMVQVEIGLPVFRGDRQDRVVESRSAELARAESLREDWLRQHRAEIRLNADDWRRLRERLRRFDETILPQARQRLDAALAAYATGNGTLVAVIEARRSLLDIHTQRLALETDAARHAAQLEYFAPPGAPS